jgi:hypothetical protein
MECKEVKHINLSLTFQYSISPLLYHKFTIAPSAQHNELERRCVRKRLHESVVQPCKKVLYAVHVHLFIGDRTTSYEIINMPTRLVYMSYKTMCGQYWLLPNILDTESWTPSPGTVLLRFYVLFWRSLTTSSLSSSYFKGIRYWSSCNTWKHADNQ